MIDDKPLDNRAPCRGELWYPGNVSEFEVQAFLYCALKSMGYDVRGEVCTRGGRCRFDLVIYRREKTGAGVRPMPIRIIEVKATRGKKWGDQVAEYRRRYGVPVDHVGGMKAATSYVRDVAAIVGVP